MDWSQDQKDAIQCDGGTVIVSAAAGSGKTAILVERIIRKITDPDEKTSIDDLLIVTFSNAAANELRVRISKKLNNILLDDYNNTYIQKQQILLENSNISTIHSFCLNLIRDNFELLGVSPDFKIGDENQIAALKNLALTEVLEDIYGDDSYSHILQLLGAGLNESNLISSIYKIYDFIKSLPFPFDWIQQNINACNRCDKYNIKNTHAFKTIMKYSTSALEQAKNLLIECKKTSSLLEEDIDKYLHNLDFKIDFVDQLLSNVESNQWTNIFSLLHSYDILPLPRFKRNVDPLTKQHIKNLHDNFKNIISTLKNNYFSASVEDFLNDMRYTHQTLTLISNIIKAFSDKFDELKKERNIFDFSDLEHFAIKLLLHIDGNTYVKTDKAKDIAGRFREILIDEYQDTSLIQECIFNAISRDESNMFMVGDAKQSIYRFRQAMPELFIMKNSSFFRYDGTSYPAKINLNQNFRSRENVTNFINFVFDQIMSDEVGEINYGKEEMLIASTPYPEHEDDTTEIHFIENDPDSSTKEQVLLEAKHIASNIKQMINNNFKITKDGKLEDAQFGDFCILMRSPKDKIKYYLSAFNSEDIPICITNDVDFFDTREIITVLSLIKAINNPNKDIDLLATMLSEIFLFTSQDVIIIKNKYKSANLFSSVIMAAQDGDARCNDFYDKIQYLKNLSNLLPLDKFIRRMYDKTDFYNIVRVSNNGAFRQRNLNLFLDYAKNFMLLGNSSLIEFILYIDSLSGRESQSRLSNSTMNSENCVKIMSIHGSKGLEFPICILADTSKNINKMDMISNILLHTDIGMGFSIVDLDKQIMYPSVIKEAIKLEIEKSVISEEMRILYVALTRAKEKLIIVIRSDNYEEQIRSVAEKLSSTSENKISPYIVKSLSSYADWILLSLIRHKDFAKLKIDLSSDSINCISTNSSIKIVINNSQDKFMLKKETDDSCDEKNGSLQITGEKNLCIDKKLYSDIENKINYKYPFDNLTKIPSKLGVSDIAKGERSEEYQFVRRPRLFYKSGFTSAEKGNILHKFMQFSNYENAKNNIYDECDRLLKSEYFSKEEIENLEIDKLNRFFTSKLYAEICCAQKVHREVKFIYPMSTMELGYTKLEDENIVIQGVADCVLEYNSEIVIIDYKTDKINHTDELIRKYKKQLQLYERALSEIFGKPIRYSVIYSFYLNRACYF